jgi:murein DD-endopeptidase MepM/ murein hydrolase activator NlpD
MKPILTAVLAALAVAAASRCAEAADLSLKACPAASLHVYPLGPGRRFQSLVVPNIALANDGATAATVSEVTFELLDKGKVVDRRTLSGEALKGQLASGPALQAGGMLQMFAFQFCDGRLLGAQPKLAGDAALPAGATGLMMNQVFGWSGSRDELRVTAVAERGGARETAALSIPLAADTVKTKLVFPLAGRWFVAVAGTPHGGHRWALPEAFAYDIVRVSADDLTYRGKGQAFADYYDYGAAVLAAGEGVVAESVTDQPEDPAVLRRPGESLDAYSERQGKLQAALVAKGDHAVAGNAVVIDHGNGEYSLYAHLQPGSIRVKAGDHVKAGQPIARLGGSGNSTEPHLHFQVCDGPSSLHCAGVPLAFTNVELPYADGPRAIQAGDIVVTH